MINFFIAVYLLLPTHDVGLKFVNKQTCPYTITVYRNDNTVLSEFDIYPGEKIKVVGSTNAMFLRVVFRKRLGYDCGCTIVNDCSTCEPIERLWETEDSFSIYLEVNDEFWISRLLCPNS